MAKSISSLGLNRSIVKVYKRNGKYHDELQLKFSAYITQTENKGVRKQGGSYDVRDPEIYFWFDYPLELSEDSEVTNDNIEFLIETKIGITENEYSNKEIWDIIDVNDVIEWHNHQYDINKIHWRQDFGEAFIRANVSYRK